MPTPKRATIAGTCAVALAASTASGCSSQHASVAADKAGGQKAPITLRLADSNGRDQPDVPALQYFAAKVAQLSGGNLHVRIQFAAAGNTVPDTEARVAKMVRDGKFDLGWIGARAWDELGVKSFQALQAPFLITDYALLDQVLGSPLAGEMLAGLKAQHVVGLALVPDLLRHPIGLRRPLVSLADYAGARLRIQPSRATASLVTALGAVPVEVGNLRLILAGPQSHVDGEELALVGAPTGSIVTANVIFFGKTLTLFAGQQAFGRLTRQQREVLQAAAERTVRHVVARPLSEAFIFRRFCNNRRVVVASPADLRQLEQAAQPVYAQLERDPLTRSLIARIRHLKATTPRDPSPAASRRCSAPQVARTPAGRTLAASVLNGTYRWVITETAARASGTYGPGDVYPSVFTATLRDGRWLFDGQPPDTGTYAVVGRQIRFVWPRVGATLVFTFTRDGDGTLHLKPVLPMERGDQFIWSGAPWRRAGPPIKQIP